MKYMADYDAHIDRLRRVTSGMRIFEVDALHSEWTERLWRARNYVWQPLLPLMGTNRKPARITQQLNDQIVKPAIVADESLIFCAQKMKAGGNPDVFGAVKGACDIYEALVPKSPESSALRDRDHVLERIREIRYENPKRTRSVTIAARLVAERLRHPDGKQWTGAAVEALVPDMFPDGPARWGAGDAGAAYERLLRRSIGRKLTVGADSTVPSERLRVGSRTTPEDDIDDRILKIIKNNPGVQGAKAVYSLARPVRKQDVFASVERLISRGRVRSERAPRNGRRLYAA